MMSSLKVTWMLEYIQGYKFNGARSILGHTSNKRNETLLHFIENLGMVVCNGRSSSDTPANFTCLDSKGVGISDMVLVSIPNADITEALEVTE